MKGPATELIHAGEIDRGDAGAADDADLRDDDVRVRQRAGGRARTTKGDRRSTSTPATRNPTVVSVEQKLAALDRAEAALLFSSGMGATTTILMAHLKAGDEVVCSAAIYGGTLHLLQDLLAQLRRDAAVRVARGAGATRSASSAIARGWSGSSRRSTRRCAAWTSRAIARGVPRARRAVGDRQHVREPDQPAAAGARRRSGDAERDEIPERPQRRHRRRGHGPAGARRRRSRRRGGCSGR